MTTTTETNIAKPRWERRKEARPAELVSAALQLFVEKGYAGTRLDDVAGRAGVSKGTLYLYFENKEELFKAVVRENIVARISQSADEVLHFDGTSAELLRRLITTWWDEYGSSTAGGIGKLMMAESGNFPEIARFFLRRGHRAVAPHSGGRHPARCRTRGISQREARDVRSCGDGSPGHAVVMEAFIRRLQPAAARRRRVSCYSPGHSAVCPAAGLNVRCVRQNA